MQSETIKTNSIKAWIKAARIYSLTAAAMPVAVGMAMAWNTLHGEHRTGDFNWWVLVLSMIFAFVMQIDANLINDYFDFKKGNDDEAFRLGPKRTCTQGWVTPEAMKCAIVIVTICGCLAGLPLAFIGGWTMVPVGVACVTGAFLYTTHLSYKGLGDVLCLLFFGLVPVCIPYYIIIGSVTWQVLMMGLAMGTVIDALMIVNNYRDMPIDEQNGKITLCVRLGKQGSQRLFFAVAPVALAMIIPYAIAEENVFLPCAVLLTFVPAHYLTYLKMRGIGEGRELNRVLGNAARNIVVFGLVTTMAILFA